MQPLHTNWYNFLNVLTRPEVAVVSVYVTVTANTWLPSSFKSKFTIFCRLLAGSRSTPSVEEGVRGRDVGVAEEGIFISASMRTFVMVFGTEEPGSCSLFAQRVQENVSPT